VTTDRNPVSAALVEQAPAKINLTLRVLGRRADGYHELESLVAFAGLADRLTLSPDNCDALEVSGPFAASCGPEAGISCSRHWARYASVSAR